MHDSFLFQRISSTLQNICKENKIIRINLLKVIVHPHSHVNEKSLFIHLKDEVPELVGDWTKVQVEREKIEELTAIIDRVEGDSIEQ